MTLTIGKQTTSQQFRLLHRDRISERNLAATDHFSIDAAVGVAQVAHQCLRDGEVARGGPGIDTFGGALISPAYALAKKRSIAARPSAVSRSPSAKVSPLRRMVRVWFASWNCVCRAASHSSRISIKKCAFGSQAGAVGLKPLGPF